MIEINSIILTNTLTTDKIGYFCSSCMLHASSYTKWSSIVGKWVIYDENTKKFVNDPEYDNIVTIQLQNVRRIDGQFLCFRSTVTRVLDQIYWKLHDQTDFDDCLHKISEAMIDNTDNDQQMDIEQNVVINNIIQNHPAHVEFPHGQ
eukprot:264978_1